MIRRKSAGVRRKNATGSGTATAIANGASLLGSLTVPSGAEIIIESGGFLSLPSIARSAGTIDAPTIRAKLDTNAGICYDDDINRIVVVLASEPYSVMREMLAAQTITAVGQSIAHDSYAPIAFKSVSTDANRTLTSNPCIDAGKYDGQLFIIRGSGSNTLTLPDGNGVQFDGGSNKALGPLDAMILRWAQSLTQWEQITPMVVV